MKVKIMVRLHHETGSNPDKIIELLLIPLATAVFRRILDRCSLKAKWQRSPNIGFGN